MIYINNLINKFNFLKKKKLEQKLFIKKNEMKKQTIFFSVSLKYKELSKTNFVWMVLKLALHELFL